MAVVGGVDLSKKIGPVPVWVLVGAGGLTLAYFINRQFAASGSASSGGGTVVEPGVGGTPGGFIPAPTPEDITAPAILDNESWAFKAVGWLLGQGYNPVEAGNAVRKYLDGQKITSRELAMITAVTRAIGAPPNIPVGGGVEDPAPPPVTTPPVVTPPVVTPPAPLPIPVISGRWFLIPVGYAPRRDASGNQYGVLDRVMKSHSYPGGINDLAGRSKIWYHQNNNALRAKYNNDWSRLREGETIFIPY